MGGCEQQGQGGVGLLPDLAMEVVAHLDEHVEGLLNVGSIQGACMLWVRAQDLTCRGLLIKHTCGGSHKMCIIDKSSLTGNTMLAMISDGGVRG